MNDSLRLDTNAADYLILFIYFVAVLGIGFAARRVIKTSLDYFLSGRSLPAWITGLAFISANLGALEILGMAANGAQFGVATVHYYWIGAVPAMVFLGIVMMPFYYGSKVRSVPEYLRLRFNRPTHLLNALSFAFATVLIAGVNLYALALVLKLLLGWPLIIGIIVAAAIVLVYITLGGLSSAIYNEVLQFFVIVAALVPLSARRPARRRRLERAEGRDHRGQGQRLPARLAGHEARGRDQPARGVVDTDRLRPRLRAQLRLLDDELRRGAARAVGQGPQRGAAHAADRRLPQALHPGHHRDPGHGRADHDPRPRRRQPGPAVQQRDPAADERVPAQRHARAGDDGPAGGVHGRRGRERVGLQHGRHLRPVGAVRAARARATSTTSASAAWPPSRASASASARR